MIVDVYICLSMSKEGKLSRLGRRGGNKKWVS